MFRFSTPFSIYLHIPFCSARCTYCAFNTYTNAESQIPRYVDALINEISALGYARPDTPVHTVFFGGGTPSLLTPVQVGSILTAIRDHFVVDRSAEITLEVNPGSIDTRYFAQLRETGVNRLSIGMQSAVDSELKLFARTHQAMDVRTAVESARACGYDNFNLDLIYGAPHQTLETWRRSVEAALELNPPHIAMYALELESGTALTRSVDNGWTPRPDDDLAADMYELADSVMLQAGLRQYEISNWAKPGLACVHNLQYWRNLPYLGIGAGAHGYADGVRYACVRPIPEYVARAESTDPVTQWPLMRSVDSHERIDLPTQMFEELMTGLRLLEEGFSATKFESRFGVPLHTVYGEPIAHLTDLGLLTTHDDRLYLTPRARLLSNIVFRAFLPETLNI